MYLLFGFIIWHILQNVAGLAIEYSADFVKDSNRKLFDASHADS